MPAQLEPACDVRSVKTVSTSLTSFQQEAHLIGKLSHLETQVATWQEQLAQLALELLHERELRCERRVTALEILVQQTRGQEAQREKILTRREQEAQLDGGQRQGRPWHPAELRARSCLIPLIEYGARGTYVVISPQAGELQLVPASPAWFEWLASLSSFRFVGRSGCFGARRGYNRRPNRGWYAQRAIHQHNDSRYLGVSENLTTTQLEQIAANLPSYADLR